jgi:hypothetical protein
MSEEESVDIVDFDPASVLAAAREAAGGDRIRVCVVYDDSDFETVFVDDGVDSAYEGPEDRADHFGQIHDYVHLDFVERELFEEMIPDPEGVRAFVTYMGSLIAIRVVVGGQGVFLSVTPDAAVSEIVDAVERALQG